MKSPVRLPRTAYDKVWGSPQTEPWHQNPERRNIGEVWFRPSDSVPLLVKLLFTRDNLSVQVHPEGKTEMWHILRAEAGARIALGVREPLTAERLRSTSESGEIMDLLNWLPARPGDTFFVPAGTIHAIGGGLALCEVQQPLNVTYRLFDYGRRDRELHIEQGLAVSNLTPHEGACAIPPRVECAFFRTERIDVRGTATLAPSAKNRICVAIEGAGAIDGVQFVPGDAIEVPASDQPITVSGDAALIVTGEP